MKIDSVPELCESIIEFKEMLGWDYEMNRSPIGDPTLARLLGNLLDEFANIADFAEQYLLDRES